MGMPSTSACKTHMGISTMKRRCKRIATGLSNSVKSLEDRVRDTRTIQQRLESLEDRVRDTVGIHAKELQAASSVATEQSKISARVNAFSSKLRSRDPEVRSPPINKGAFDFSSSLHSPRLDGMGASTLTLSPQTLRAQGYVTHNTSPQAKSASPSTIDNG